MQFCFYSLSSLFPFHFLSFFADRLKWAKLKCNHRLPHSFIVFKCISLSPCPLMQLELSGCLPCWIIHVHSWPPCCPERTRQDKKKMNRAAAAVVADAAVPQLCSIVVLSSIYRSCCIPPPSLAKLLVLAFIQPATGDANARRLWMQTRKKVTQFEAIISCGWLTFAIPS